MLLAHFRSLLAHERDANRRTISSLRSVPDHQQRADAFKRARGIFGHVQNARRLWLSRLGGCRAQPFVMFPDFPVDALEDDSRVLDSLWQAYLDGLGESDLARDVSYTSVEGAAFRSVIGDILTQVFQHSSYHRGQIAMLVTQCQGERAVTDYIAFTRKPSS